MGYNTTVVVMNDYLHDIEKDQDFNKKLVDAILHAQIKTPVDVSAGSAVNAATVIESHNSQGLIPVLVGSNTGIPLNVSLPWYTQEEERELELARRLAEKHGYTLRKMPSR